MRKLVFNLYSCDLIRILHGNSTAACENLISTPSVSPCSLVNTSGRETVVQPCLYQAVRCLATNHHEIFGLRLLLITLFIAICFLPGGILHAQESGSCLIEQNKAITVEEYALFLNECATNDPYHLYEAKENSIIRLGAVGEFQYSFITEEAKKPVMLLSTLDAIRYCHWKHHQNEELEIPQKSVEQSINRLLDNEIIPINDKHSLCLKWIVC